MTVLRERRLKALGLRHDDVVAYDLFPPAERGCWYGDLVRVADEGDLIRVDDLWIDVIVGPPDHPYRVLDLDEYGQALAGGDLSVADAADGLARLQRFLDRRLNRLPDDVPHWVDFPPPAVEALLAADLPREWSMLGA